MNRFYFWIGLILVFSFGCSKYPPSTASGASGIAPEQMAGTWVFILPANVQTLNANLISLKSDHTAQISWPLPNQNGGQHSTFCYAGTWTIDSHGSGSITASANCGAGGKASVNVNFQVSRDLNLFIFSMTIGLPNQPTTSSVVGTAVRQ